MSGFIRTLSIVLIIQVALASYLQFSGESLSAPAEKTPLLAASLQDPDQFTIRDGEGNSVTIRKSDTGWILPGINDFPASGTRVADFLTALKSFKKGWPVGNTQIAAKQFKVAQDEHERKVEVEKGKDKASLFLGTSPGFKKIYARVGGSDETYTIEFSTYQAGVKSKDWYDSKYATRDKATIQQININDITISKEGKELALKDVPEDKTVVTEELQKVIAQTSDLFISDVLGIEAKDEYGLSSPAVSFTLTFGDERKETFSFGLPEGEKADYAALKIDSSPFYLKVAKGVVEKLKGMTKATLLKDKETQEKAETSAAASDKEAEQESAMSDKEGAPEKGTDATKTE